MHGAKGVSELPNDTSSDCPLVTVVIPSFNPGKYLFPAVRSILTQTYTNLEVLLVDDGSTDNSSSDLDGIADTRLTLLKQPNSGKALAMNRAISRAHGELIVIQDADDISYPTRIQEMVAWMTENPHLCMLFSGHDLIIGNHVVAPTSSPLSEYEAKQAISDFRMPGHDPTVMVTARVAKEFPFDPSLSVGQGFDFVLRVGEKYPCARLGRCLYSYRVSANSNTKRSVARRKIFVRQVLRSAHSRRGLPIPVSLDIANDVCASEHVSAKDFDNNLPAHFIESVLDQKRAGMAAQAFRTGVFCARMRPFSFHFHKALIYSLLPLRLISAIRFNFAKRPKS